MMRRGSATLMRWTCKSTTRLAQELNRQGHQVSQRSVCDLLAQRHYSLQSTRKTREGSQHPDRDAQFGHIVAMVAQYQSAGQHDTAEFAVQSIRGWWLELLDDLGPWS